MNRNLWLVLFGAISLVSLMIAHKAGSLYGGGASEVSELVVTSPERFAEPLRDVSEAFMRAYPDVSVRVEVMENEVVVGDVCVTQSAADGLGYSALLSPKARNLGAARRWLDFFETAPARAIMAGHGPESVMSSASKGQGSNSEAP